MDIQKNSEVLHSFIEESRESLEKIGNAFIRLENDPANMSIIDEIFRPIHSLKGNSGFFDLTNINKFSHRIENLIDFIRKDKLAVDREIINVLLSGVDYLQNMLDRADDDSGEVSLRAEEEEFLKTRVDKFKPREISGSIQSLFDLKHLLEEASELGIDLEQNTLISKVLSQIEKANIELKDVVESHKESQRQVLFSGDARFIYNGTDYSHLLKPIGEALGRLKQKKMVEKDLLETYFDSLVKLEKMLGSSEKIKKDFETLKAMSNFLDDQLLVESDTYYSDISRLMNNLTSFLKVETSFPTDVKRVGEILIDQNKITEKQLSDALNSQKRIGEILVQKGVIDSKDVREALSVQEKQILNKERQSKDGELKKTIRIDQDKLDDFANAVGELFINIDAFSFIKKQLDGKIDDFEITSRFASSVSALDGRITKLQESIMDIRKVPINKLFQRFPKVVRQLSNALEKETQFVLSGEETVIDKDLIEKIENPLVHMLRNAIDHGIENEAVRLKKGKPLQGRIELSAWVDEYYVHLSIKDDGAGIDPQKMKKIAVEKNFMTEAEASQLSGKELINLIFRPGFSTADTISDISGRGVGMDVVLSSLNKCNGIVKVDSIKDKGTTVSIKIPLTKTLVTKEVLIVESAGQHFAVPSEEITTTLSANIHFGSILSKEKIISYNNNVHHVICLSSFFYPDTNKLFEKKSDQVIVVCGEYKTAIIVDKIVNHQKIVLKTFTKGLRHFGNTPGISGYTLLGNEDIVLVVDVADVINYQALRN